MKRDLIESSSEFAKKSPHKSVLLNEVLNAFSGIKSDCQGVFVDCTMGYGGHSEAILRAFPNAKILGIDQDKEARNFCSEKFAAFIKSSRVKIHAGRFGVGLAEFLSLAEKAQNLEIESNLNIESSLEIESFAKIAAKYGICGILADLGVSSLQFDKKERGFCFDSEVLDMRMDSSQMLSARELVNTASLQELEKIFRDFGEIREYKKLARIIVEERRVQPFESARELSSLISKNFTAKRAQKIHPATLAFQALRIAVNNELGELNTLLELLQKHAKILQKSNCICAIISFHSLEDRAVKLAFNDLAKNCICPSSALKCTCGANNAKGAALFKKPQSPSEQECNSNPRARSAKLRAFRFN